MNTSWTYPRKIRKSGVSKMNTSWTYPRKIRKKRCVRDMQDRPSGSVIQVEKEVKATKHRNLMSQCAQERECAPRMMSRDTIFYQILENKNSEMRLMQQNLKREMYEARLESDRQFYALQEQRLLAMAGYNSNFFWRLEKPFRIKVIDNVINHTSQARFLKLISAKEIRPESF